MSIFFMSVVGALVTGSLSAPAPAPSSVSVPPPALATGSVPLGASVSAVLRPSGRSLHGLAPGEGLPELRVPVTRTDHGFEVRLSRSSVPAGFVGDGVVTVVLTAADSAGRRWVTRRSARATGVGERSRWARPDAPFAGRPAAGTLEDAGPSTRVTWTDLGRPAPGSERAMQVPCGPRVLSKQRVAATIATTYPVGRSTAWLDVDHSNGGQYQSAIKVPRHPARRAEMQHAQGGWGATTYRRGDGRRYVTSVEYATIDNRYRDTAGLCQYYLTYEPTVETGQMTPKPSARPSYGHCVPVGRTVWRRNRSDGSPFRLAGGVSSGALVGFSLAVSKQYGTSSHTVKYDVPGTVSMCGSNSTPGTASRIMARARVLR